MAKKKNRNKNRGEGKASPAVAKQTKPSRQSKAKRKKPNPILIAFATVVVTPFLPLFLLDGDAVINAKLEHVCTALVKHTYPEAQIEQIDTHIRNYPNLNIALQSENPTREEMDGYDYRAQYNSLDIAYSYGRYMEARDVTIEAKESADGPLASPTSCHFRSRFGYLHEQLVFERFKQNYRDYPTYAAWFVFDDSVDYIYTGSTGYLVSMDTGLKERWDYLYQKVKSLFIKG
ncbi:hypothetical protein [Vibrio intestinalis]|uniref:hypothetical protein n=1 Tax=Vibrio intestinalis TaxID=2933291 RepID=UPI0021A26EE2|nr:hypothetical protein [Vibrio intestinalis]